MSRLISFSIWGTQDKYLKGALRRVEEAERCYPGWVCRFYYQVDGPKPVPAETVQALSDAGCQVCPKGYYRDPWFGLYWRFCPMYDDVEIERFVVRDTDSPITPRESDAVQQWIESGKPFHIMRDNTQHNIEILGGMWGSIPGLIPQFEKHLKDWMHTIDGHKENPMGRFHGTDQEFLAKWVWPVVKNNHLAHGIKYLGNEIPFRVTNPDGQKVGVPPGYVQPPEPAKK